MNYFSHRHKTGNRGLTLVELLVSLGVAALIVTGVTRLGRDIFFLNNITQANLNAQFEGRRAMRFFTSELREASQSSAGAYPIAAAATSSITFFSDIDNDGLKEQVRYFVQGKNVKKGVIKPTGSPLVYNSGAEVITTPVTDLANGTSTPVFTYYDATYAGTSTPLSLPINIPSVRLVYITLVVDTDPNRSPTPLVVTSAVTIRNLKDNL